jgi:murein L,D-transpeptidase YafK
MTDEQIAEIYALAREAFFGGQKSFQLHAYPFRMTPLNMARHRNSPHMAFWKMIKQGYDPFRGHTPRTQGRCLRQKLRFRHRIDGQLLGGALPQLHRP